MKTPKEKPAAQRVLLFRLGSLGDTLVALPAFRMIARRFPDAERRVLTNFSVSEKAAPMAALLDGTDLVQGYFRFPPRGLDARALFALALEVRRWKPSLVVYMHEPRSTLIALRDAAFFRACGISRMVGFQNASALKKMPVFLLQLNRFEHKAEFLARNLAALGDSRLSERSSWDPALSDSEREHAVAALLPLSGCSGIIAASIGSKVDVKDWGDDNWRNLLHALSVRLPGWALVMIGAPTERARSADLLPVWQGKSINLCGSIALRECGAVLELSDVYVGHDSGPMHLAAAVGTPCIAIFSARNYPGEWFPYGEGHTVFYKQTECFGCRLDECVQFRKKCILSIGVEEVADAAVAKAMASPTRKLPGFLFSQRNRLCLG